MLSLFYMMQLMKGFSSNTGREKNNKKIYKCYDLIGPGVTVRAPERCCLFCKHCSDVYWDYTHGPYMTICAEGHDEKIGGQAKCKYFRRG